MTDQLSAANDPIEVRLIEAASGGSVHVTPEKCERVRRILDREIERERKSFARNVLEVISILPVLTILRDPKDVQMACKIAVMYAAGIDPADPPSIKTK